MRVIVDTNIFVSGLINPGGAPGAIIDAVLDGRITPVFSAETLAEFRDVMTRPRLRRFFNRAAIEPQTLLDRLVDVSEVLDPARPNTRFATRRIGPSWRLLSPSRRRTASSPGTGTSNGVAMATCQ